MEIFIILILLGLMKHTKSTRKNGITYVAGKMLLRGCDTGGCGHFGASRSGGRTHKGIDILCIPNLEVFAPFDCLVERKVDPYGDNKYDGLQLLNNLGFELKIMYFEPLEGIVGHEVKQGEILGYCQDISKKYGSHVPPHLHIELKNTEGVRIDPTAVLFP
jgi:Peptidase family M23